MGTNDARLTAVTTTRAGLLASFIGLGALGTFWLNSRVYQITARTFEVTERGDAFRNDEIPGVHSTRQG